MNNKAKHTTLKSLETRLAESNAKISNFESQIQEVRKSLKEERKRNDSLKKEIEKLKHTSKELIISEHATLRYIERVLGIDISEIHKKMLPEYLGAAKIINNGKYGIGDNHRIVVKDNVVVTVE